MLSHFVAVCLALLPFAQCIPVHEHMTREEVSKTFQTGHDNVPGYEVVRIYHTLHKRDILDDSTRMVKLNTLNRNFSLYLSPNSGLLVGESTPVWTVVEHVGWPNGTKYWRDRQVLANIGKAYHDVSKRSAIVAYEGEDGETLIHGTLLENIIVRPLPYRLHNTMLRERRDLVDLLPDGVDGNTDFRRSHYHVVFERPERDINATHDGVRVVERERRVSRQSPTDDPSEASIPDIVYPEILIFVDFYLYETVGKSVVEAARYVLAFWNGVDLRYRLLEKPVIRLNIAGIVISLQPRGIPYLDYVRQGDNAIDSRLFIEAMSRYLSTESYRFSFDSYDFAVTMTSVDSFRIPAAICYHAGACTGNHLKMTTNAVAILRDRGGFDGIWNAAEATADLMSARPNSIESSKDGPVEDEQIYLTYSFEFDLISEKIQFSTYHLKEIYAFLSTPNSICLLNEPRGGKALPRILPGELRTADEQCKRKLGTKAAVNGEENCNNIECLSPWSDVAYWEIGPAAEGTSCGYEKYCINGYCVSPHVKYVPNAVAH